MSSITFLAPSILVVYPAVLILAVLFILWREWVRRRTLAQLGDIQLVTQLLEQISPVRRVFKIALWLITLSATFIALARPVWGFTEETMVIDYHPVIIIVDISLSMDAQDILPSRLRRAIIDMDQLVNDLENAQVAIVVVTSQAYTYMPMTFDTASARIFLSSISTQMLSLQGTDLNQALEQVLIITEELELEDVTAILASDGEHHGMSLESKLGEIRQRGITVHAIGYGNAEGTLIPILDERGNTVDYKTDPAGKLVTTQLVEDALQSITQATNGLYFRATDLAETDGLQILADTLNQQTASATTSVSRRRPAEQFIIFVWVAMLALSIEMLFSEASRRRIT